MLRRSLFRFNTRAHQTLPYDANKGDGGFRDPKVLFGMCRPGVKAPETANSQFSRGAGSLFAQKEKEAMEKLGKNVDPVAAEPKLQSTTAPREPRAGEEVKSKSGFERTEEMIKNLRNKKKKSDMFNVQL